MYKLGEIFMKQWYCLFVLTLILSYWLIAQTPEDSESAVPTVGQLEVVAILGPGYNPGNITVNKDNRIFLSMHQFRPCNMRVAELVPDKGLIPFPNKEWNGEPGSGPDVFNAVLGVQVDTKNRLWVLDNGGYPKLLAFDCVTKELCYRHDFLAEVARPGSFLNDLAVDAERGFVYIADIGGKFSPALIILDVNKDVAWRLEGHTSFAAEDINIIVDGRIMMLPDANGNYKPSRIGINPITLSADNETLYYGSMCGLNWWSIPTALLRNKAEQSVIFSAIQRVGPKPISDGASTDIVGRHYFTNVGENAIDVLIDGKLSHVCQDPRISWPDALSFGGDLWLYFVCNQLHTSPPLNNGIEGGQPPYYVFRVWTGTSGIPGR